MKYQFKSKPVATSNDGFVVLRRIDLGKKVGSKWVLQDLRFPENLKNFLAYGKFDDCSCKLNEYNIKNPIK